MKGDADYFYSFFACTYDPGWEKLDPLLWRCEGYINQCFFFLVNRANPLDFSFLFPFYPPSITP